MIVCHCGVVSDRDVARAVDAGARTVAQVCSNRSRPSCGTCIFSLKRLVCEHVGRRSDTRMEVEGAAR